MSVLKLCGVVGVVTLLLAACTGKLIPSTQTQVGTQSDRIETTTQTTAETDQDSAVDSTPVLRKGDDVDSLSADLNATVIFEESFD